MNTLSQTAWYAWDQTITTRGSIAYKSEFLKTYKQTVREGNFSVSNIAGREVGGFILRFASRCVRHQCPAYQNAVQWEKSLSTPMAVFQLLRACRQSQCGGHECMKIRGESWRRENAKRSNFMFVMGHQNVQITKHSILSLFHPLICLIMVFTEYRKFLAGLHSELGQEWILRIFWFFI